MQKRKMQEVRGKTTILRSACLAMSSTSKISVLLAPAKADIFTLYISGRKSLLASLGNFLSDKAQYKLN